IDADRGVAHRAMHPIVDAKNTAVLSAAEQHADERDLRQHGVDRISWHKRAADVDLVMLKINPALRGESDIRIVDNRVLNLELARGALKGRRHLLKTNAGRIDRDN